VSLDCQWCNQKLHFFFEVYYKPLTSPSKIVIQHIETFRWKSNRLYCLVPLDQRYNPFPRSHYLLCYCLLDKMILLLTITTSFAIFHYCIRKARGYFSLSFTLHDITFGFSDITVVSTEQTMWHLLMQSKKLNPVLKEKVNPRWPLKER